MKAIITGAGGFVGKQLVANLVEQGEDNLCLFDFRLDKNAYPTNANLTLIEGDICDASKRAEMLDRDFDTIFHLAAVPGGAAEKDPALSQRVNLDATLALINEAAERVEKLRFVYTSTIAVFGPPLPQTIDDSTPLNPLLVYGAHKAMIEIALANLSAQNKIDSVAVRLPGILARPPAPAGLKSAFYSNLFHDLKAGKAFTSPVSPNATTWLMSVEQCANNLIHASRVDSSLMPANRCVTLPVIRTSMEDLIASVATACNTNTDSITYDVDKELEASFAAQPPANTAAAERAGFKNDGSLDLLVERALKNC